MVVKMVIPFLRLGYSRPFQLTLVHVGPLILQVRAGNLLSIIVSGTMILGLIWRDCRYQYTRSWASLALELSGETSSHNIFEFNIFNPYRSAVHSTMVEEYDSDRETIEDWEEWNTNLLNFIFSRLKWANLQSKQAKKKEDKLAEESLQGFETD